MKPSTEKLLLMAAAVYILSKIGNAAVAVVKEFGRVKAMADKFIEGGIELSPEMSRALEALQDKRSTTAQKRAALADLRKGVADARAKAPVGYGAVIDSALKPFETKVNALERELERDEAKAAKGPAAKVLKVVPATSPKTA